jgi:hypothetical protein
MFWQEKSKTAYVMKYVTKLFPKKSTAVWLEIIQYNVLNTITLIPQKIISFVDQKWEVQDRYSTL